MVAEEKAAAQVVEVWAAATVLVAARELNLEMSCVTVDKATVGDGRAAVVRAAADRAAAARARAAGETVRGRAARLPIPGIHRVCIHTIPMDRRTAQWKGSSSCRCW